MSDAQSTNTHEVVAELFRAMNTPNDVHSRAKIKSWANQFPYVNGGLYREEDGRLECPRFSKIARSYLLRCGELDWQLINPDIFGSMIQAVADDNERGSLGMHYTSVPNILKVLDPLFLDDVRAQLTDAALQGCKSQLAAYCSVPATPAGRICSHAHFHRSRIQL